MAAALLSSQVLFAETGLVETCSYNESKQFLQILKDTVGLRSSSQIGALEGMVKALCVDKQGLAIKEGLSEKAASTAIQAGIKRAVNDTFGNAEILGIQSWEEIALSNLRSTLRQTFSDPNLDLNDQSLSKTKQDATNMSLSGTTTLTNGFSCEVISEVPNSAQDGQENCTVKIVCRKDSQIQVQKVEKNCAAFR